MKKTEAEKMVAALLANVAGMKYGEAGVSLTIHNGRVVEVAHRKIERQKTAAREGGSHESATA